MLNKEEREAIAERVDKITFNKGSIYEALLGPDLSNCRTLKDEFEALVDKIIDLCDMSNMLELPLDKDGEVIRADDTVFDNTGKEWVVSHISVYSNSYVVAVRSYDDLCSAKPDELTHKKPVTIASLISEIRRTLSQNTIMNKESAAKLWEITDQIEMLSDSDE